MNFKCYKGSEQNLNADFWPYFWKAGQERSIYSFFDLFIYFLIYLYFYPFLSTFWQFIDIFSQFFIEPFGTGIGGHFLYEQNLSLGATGGSDGDVAILSSWGTWAGDLHRARLALSKFSSTELWNPTACTARAVSASYEEGNLCNGWMRNNHKSGTSREFPGHPVVRTRSFLSLPWARVQTKILQAVQCDQKN